MKKIIIILAIVFALPIFILGQGNILWLTNGKKIEIGEYQIVKNNVGVGFIQYKSLKNKSKAIGSHDVFSIIEKNHNEIIVYYPDSLEESFNLLEMRAFVQGQTDALNFKSPSTFVGGVVVGSFSVLTLNPLLAIPFGGCYGSGVGLTKPRSDKITVPPEYCNNQNYLLGYKKKIKEKRIKNALIGYGIGLAVGFTVFTIHRGGVINGRNN